MTKQNYHGNTDFKRPLVLKLNERYRTTTDTCLKRSDTILCRDTDLFAVNEICCAIWTSLEYPLQEGTEIVITEIVSYANRQSNSW